GTGAPLAGLSRFSALLSPGVEMVRSAPAGSILASYAKTGVMAPAKGGWLVEGIGGDSIPPVADFSRVGATYTIPDAEAFLTCRELLRKEGIIAGTSTGPLLAAALRYCRGQKDRKPGVT